LEAGNPLPDLDRQSFVLCHGAWHGGWCWRDVARALRARGAEVFTPTMTGMGERHHLREGNVSVATYISDVCGVIEAEELTNVTLVGHSFGGMAITGVADHVPDRIKRLVYLDAAVPKDGQSLITQSVANSAAKNEALVNQFTDMLATRGSLPVPDMKTLGMDTASQEMQDWENRRMVPHPISSFIEPLHFVNGGPQAPCTYIVCDSPPMPNTSFLAHYHKIAAGEYGDHWTARRIATGHMAMMTALDETVALLAEAALAPSPDNETRTD
jgi:pimeloyl-ACP methyl ester carboxylesterase